MPFSEKSLFSSITYLAIHNAFVIYVKRTKEHNIYLQGSQIVAFRYFEQNIAQQLVQGKLQRRETVLNKTVAEKMSTRSDMVIRVDN